ncbi:MAG TPA: Smr/MutS family protein [Rhizomicrobium sp.]|jgi:DNA-nicking Smr family endonuclease
MKRRIASEEERKEFEAAFKEARPLLAVAPKRPRKGASGSSTEPTGIDGGRARDLKKGALEPQARLDLHGMTEQVAHRALTTFLRGAQGRGLRLLLIVTGKGARAPEDRFEMGGEQRGVLKALTPRWLREQDLAGIIADIRPAHRKHGGNGALYVYLRKR